MKDMNGREIHAGDIIRHGYGIPPTTVDLFVFEDNNPDYFLVVDKNGRMTELFDGIASSSRLMKIMEGES